MGDSTPSDEHPVAPFSPPRRGPGQPRKAAGPALKLQHRSGRTAAQKVDDASHITLTLPVLGTVRLPEPQRLTFYAAIGALGVLGVLVWLLPSSSLGVMRWPQISTTVPCNSSETHSKTPDRGVMPQLGDAAA